MTTPTAPVVQDPADMVIMTSPADPDGHGDVNYAEATRGAFDGVWSKQGWVLVEDQAEGRKLYAAFVAKHSLSTDDLQDAPPAGDSLVRMQHENGNYAETTLTAFEEVYSKNGWKLAPVTEGEQTSSTLTEQPYSDVARAVPVAAGQTGGAVVATPTNEPGGDTVDGTQTPEG